MESLRSGDVAAAGVQKTPHRVTLDSMIAKIAAEEYINPGVLPHLTICVIRLENGFSLVGKSAPADAGNFDPDLGRKFAREDAIRQMWPLEGYAPRERLAAVGGGPMTTKKTTALDLDRIRRLAARIEELHRSHFTDLVHQLETEERMVLTKVRNGAGGSTCRMAGITVTSTSGDHGAVTNWANAARRALLKGGAA